MSRRRSSNLDQPGPSIAPKRKKTDALLNIDEEWVSRRRIKCAIAQGCVEDPPTIIGQDVVSLA